MFFSVSVWKMQWVRNVVRLQLRFHVPTDGRNAKGAVHGSAAGGGMGAAGGGIGSSRLLPSAFRYLGDSERQLERRRKGNLSNLSHLSNLILKLLRKCGRRDTLGPLLDLWNPLETWGPLQNFGSGICHLLGSSWYHKRQERPWYILGILMALFHETYTAEKLRPLGIVASKSWIP